MTIINLPWTSPPLTLNTSLRSENPFAKAAKVRDAKRDALLAILAAKVQPHLRAEVTLHFRVPNRRRRDADNLVATLKVCQDALVTAGVLGDDGWATVPAATCRIHPPNGEPAAMWLELEEVA